MVKTKELVANKGIVDPKEPLNHVPAEFAELERKGFMSQKHLSYLLGLVGVGDGMRPTNSKESRNYLLRKEDSQKFRGTKGSGTTDEMAIEFMYEEKRVHLSRGTYVSLRPKKLMVARNLLPGKNRYISDK